MANLSPIEWTESTWNPVTGCSMISSGCEHCYAFRMAKRLQAMKNKNYINGFDVAFHENMLPLPLKWKKPRLIFVNSMSDIFHENIPFEFIKRIFDTMRKAHWHTFQVLTKRSKRMAELSKKLIWAKNIWMGVTVESNKYIERIDDLKNVPALTRFLSLEPLLGAISTLELDGIHWVIVGGESGPGARPMKETWVDTIHEQCSIQHVPFFFKQWGGTNKKKAGRILHGNIYSEMPENFIGLVKKSAVGKDA